MELHLLPNETFICPFTKKGLRLLSEHELAMINNKCERQELLFYSGVPVNFEIQQAFVSTNFLYIYPVHEGVVLLKKATSIVSGNRIEHPFLARDQKKVEDFYQAYGFQDEGRKAIEGNAILEDAIKDEVRNYLPKQGETLISANANSASDVLNLVYGCQYQYHIHLDHDLERLRAVQGSLERTSTQVLCDQVFLPLQSASVASFIDLDLNNALDKSDQVALYKEMTRVLSATGVCVKLYSDSKNFEFKKLLAADKLAKKAKNLLKPWKTQEYPSMYFIQIQTPPQGSSAELNVKKTKFSSQFS